MYIKKQSEIEPEILDYYKECEKLAFDPEYMKQVTRERILEARRTKAPSMRPKRPIQIKMENGKRVPLIINGKSSTQRARERYDAKRKARRHAEKAMKQALTMPQINA